MVGIGVEFVVYVEFGGEVFGDCLGYEVDDVVDVLWFVVYCVVVVDYVYCVYVVDGYWC